MAFYHNLTEDLTEREKKKKTMIRNPKKKSRICFCCYVLTSINSSINEPSSSEFMVLAFNLTYLI